ncbi:putative CtpA-like serine protease [Planctomycetes bacterium Pan216]|uniref:Putative CtpA-like serine protease n=1 Tax=Kolteria novifilia TaxID=2527975 RepID=A0A518B7G1_9BACT|nr:putative CtpA-like serine protease [Planctomycetes bacterium Pan216]
MSPLVLSAWLLTIPQMTTAESSWLEMPRVWAVVVAIEEYEDQRIPGRRFARRDGAELYDVITSPSIVGASPDHAWLLTDRPDAKRGALLATASNLRGVLRTISRQSGPHDILLLSFKVSGIPSGSEFRWLLHGTDFSRLSETTIRSSELKDLIEHVRCHDVLTLADVCFAMPARVLERQAALADANWPGLFKGLLGPRRFVFSANEAHDPCPVSTDHREGLFAHTVIEGLSGKADTAGEEPDGWITAAELWDYLAKQLPVAAQETVGTDANAIPVLFGGEQPPYVRIARHTEVWPQRRKQLGDLLEAHQAGRIDAETYADGVRLLRMMPRFDEDRELRRDYERFLAGELKGKDLSDQRLALIRRRHYSPNDALQFATDVLEARNRIEDDYVRPDVANWALEVGIRGLLRSAGEEVPTSIEKRLAQRDQLSEDDWFDLLMQTRLYLGTRDDLPGRTALDLLLARMLESLDPFSRYLTREDLQELRRKNEGHFAGIGVLLGEDEKNHQLRVVTPVLGGPAFRAGLRAGDRIAAIDGRKVAEIPYEQALDLLEGRKGSTVTISVLQEGEAEPKSMTIERGPVQIESVVGLQRRPDHSWDYWLDKKDGIGYVRLTRFANDTPQQLRRVLSNLRRHGLRALVLDLRFNPGGLLESATEVADLFLDDGLIVDIRSRTGRSRSIEAHRFGTYRDLALVVMINRESASGSEIVSAALADHQRAKLVGERSFGKGSVQEFRDLERGGGLKLTTATFHRPNGANLHRFPEMGQEETWGVRPEPALELPLYREDVAQLEDMLEDQKIIRRKPNIVNHLENDSQLRRALRAARVSSR